jgi:HTH-type transcriptional regulator / antitoxin HigA
MSTMKMLEVDGFRIPGPITSDAQNKAYTEKLLELESRPHLNRGERAFAEILTGMIERYEEEHYPIPDVSPREILIGLMDGNNLKQKDLVSELGSESVVSAVLSGHRELSKAHIRNLSKRFHVPTDLFF